MIVENLVNSKDIERSVNGVAEYIESQNTRSHSDWRHSPEEGLWRELVSCILGSRTIYETSQASTVHLWNNRLLDPSRIVAEPEIHEREIFAELSKAIYPPFGENGGRRYQYPKSRSRYIIESASRLYSEGCETLGETLSSHEDGEAARAVLAETLVGIGYKQASLFLRNVSHSRDLAILDTHVMRFMKLMKLVDNGRTLNLGKGTSYICVENALRDYAESIGKSLSALDLAIWVVMRLVRREYVVWQL